MTGVLPVTASASIAPLVALTETLVASDVDQVTDLSEALSGSTTAVRVSFPPISSDNVAGETVTLVTST